MKSNPASRTARGFSLLEVLIAIVILSVGLLALASLQLSLIRSSNDTKAQSIAMALAKEKIEQLASYETLGGSSSTCVSPSNDDGVNALCYRAITDETLAVVDGDAVATGNQPIGGIEFSRQTVVARYVWDKSENSGAGGFRLVSDVALDSAVKATYASSLPGKEFKRVLVTVQWTDSGNTLRRVQVEDALSGIAPSDSMAVSHTEDFTGPRKAIAIISNPSAVDGVIPIAIGDGTDTAATNPRPVLVGQGQNNTVVETRFDIYTYAAINDDSATAQSRVETAAVGCTCTLGTGTQTAYRPTYWNGFEYKAPVTSTNMPVSTPNNVTQSDLCTACCRDHHDPSGVAGPKYDPRRTTHNHYNKSDLTTPVASGTYHEACRLIRVDGIFRVAAEPYNDHFGLLATKGMNTSTPTDAERATTEYAVPATGTGSMTALYQAFVLNYLNSRFVSGTAYNTVTDPTTVSGYAALQDPASAAIDNDSDPQYLHARGLIIDYLHTDAIAAITSAKASCVTAGCTDAEKQTAVLKLLPFTSINLTELGIADSTDTNIVIVSDSGFELAPGQDLPTKGATTLGNGADEDETANGYITIQRSSAGLLAGNLSDIVFPSSELTDNMLTDAQVFEIGAASGGGGSGDQEFTVDITGITNFVSQFLPQVHFYRADPNTLEECNDDDVNIVPYTCPVGDGAPLPQDVALRIGNYNTSFTGANSGIDVQNRCTNSPNDTTKMPYRTDSGVVSVTVTPTRPVQLGTVVNDGVVGIIGDGGEYTPFSVTGLDSGDAITIDMGTLYYCPDNWNSYINNSGDEAGSGTCTGSGNNAKPAWSATLNTACPNGFSPFNGQ